MIEYSEKDLKIVQETKDLYFEAISYLNEVSLYNTSRLTTSTTVSWFTGV